ncbi:MAG: TetR/AcrR family transcriptional regulator C-terminal domain-containing protein [Oscillospiraceae bacterium]|nr:TetR/AcrR family transcriptional regulator C-terminal domain-containing protein [Oscillospiraceae bacterium]
MADSNSTKRALAGAMKSLLQEIPFSGIRVSDICKKCDMNRKSFYYHFKDKYDLINWIYDTEFAAAVDSAAHLDPADQLLLLCEYFYANRTFYRKALEIQGQNSFSDHFCEYLSPLIRQRFNSGSSLRLSEFQTAFMADACLCALRRWLSQRRPLPPDEFARQMLQCLSLADPVSG